MLSFGMANLTEFHGHFMAAPRWSADAFWGGLNIFNLRQGITPDANTDNVQLMIDTVRKAPRGTLACDEWGFIGRYGIDKPP
jgi:hypothetical protein